MECFIHAPKCLFANKLFFLFNFILYLLSGFRTAVTAQRLLSTPEEEDKDDSMKSMIGRNVIALCNLKSRSFLGVESTAMLLFSTNDDNQVLTLYSELIFHFSFFIFYFLFFIFYFLDEL